MIYIPILGALALATGTILEKIVLTSDIASSPDNSFFEESIAS